MDSNAVVTPERESGRAPFSLATSVAPTDGADCQYQLVTSIGGLIVVNIHCMSPTELVDSGNSVSVVSYRIIYRVYFI